MGKQQTNHISLLPKIKCPPNPPFGVDLFMLGSVGNVRWSETLLIHLADIHLWMIVSLEYLWIAHLHLHQLCLIINLSFGYFGSLNHLKPLIFWWFFLNPLSARRCGRRRSSGVRWRSNASGAGATADGNGSEIQLEVQLGLHMVDKIW